MKQDCMVDKKQCEICHGPIVERYYLIVGDLMSLHEYCLRCAACSRLIDQQKKCLYRDGKFYCSTPECCSFNSSVDTGLDSNDDYYDLSSSSSSSSSSAPSLSSSMRKRTTSLSQLRPCCQKCSRLIEQNQYFIRLDSNNRFYHIDCFRCARCMCRIEPGSLYGLTQIPNTSSEELLCQSHYRLFYETNHSQLLGSMTNYTNTDRLTTPESSSSSSDHHRHQNQSDLNNNPTLINLENMTASNTTTTTTSSNSTSSTSLIRPKLETIVSVSNRFQVENNSASISTPTITTASIANSSTATTTSNNGTSSVAVNHHRKKKRVRTSFKHQQLRMMKAHFQVNQNPDSKELKELSERTGLQKRVLQVWFQNSRAKQRKFSTMLSSGSATVDLGGISCVSRTGLELYGGAIQQQQQQQEQQQQTSSVGDEDEDAQDHEDNYSDSDSDEQPSDSTGTSDYLFEYFEPILR